jgi:hypothetical protein
MLGKRTAGCEGTHGVFPRCNLACTPCYHSREANRVRTDGTHTVAEVDRQMAQLRAVRGPGAERAAHRRRGDAARPRRPRAGAAGHAAPRAQADVDVTRRLRLEHLERLVIDPATGERRLEHLSFAGHFDSLMFGRRGIKRVRSEDELNEHRRRFCEMFERLEREHGVTSYLAHNMTVTPRNIGSVAQVIRDCRAMGFRMFSFQPAAYVGNENRWKEELRAFGGDEVWAEIEAGAGGRCTTTRCRSATCAATARRTAGTPATATCRCSTRTATRTGAGWPASSLRSAAWTSSRRPP